MAERQSRPWNIRASASLRLTSPSKVTWTQVENPRNQRVELMLLKAALTECGDIPLKLLQILNQKRFSSLLIDHIALLNIPSVTIANSPNPSRAQISVQPTTFKVTDKGDSFFTYLHGSIFPHTASQAALCSKTCPIVSGVSERLAQIGSKTTHASVPEGTLLHPVRVIASANSTTRLNTSLDTICHRLELVRFN